MLAGTRHAKTAYIPRGGSKIVKIVRIGDCVSCNVSPEQYDRVKYAHRTTLQTGTVVYIHPEGRYAMVEFQYGAKKKTKMRMCFSFSEMRAPIPDRGAK